MNTTTQISVSDMLKTLLIDDAFSVHDLARILRTENSLIESAMHAKAGFDAMTHRKLGLLYARMHGS
jgi:hypothetical protein